MRGTFVSLISSDVGGEIREIKKFTQAYRAFALETEIILSCLRLHPSTAFQTLVDHDGYSVSSKGFLPTVVDIIII